MIEKKQIKAIALDAFEYLNEIKEHVRKEELDCKVESYIFERIKNITDSVKLVSEEYGNLKMGTTIQQTIVIDPIDGTGNVIRGIPIFSVAIALLNGALDRASVEDVEYSIVVSTFGIYEADKQDAVEQQNLDNISIEEALIRCTRPFRLRMLGASTVELGLLGSGSIDGFVEIKGLKSVDLLPILLFLKKKGCFFSDKDGNELVFGLSNPKENCFSILAARSEELLKKLVTKVKEKEYE